MIKEDEIEELRKHLDENGKLIISDDLTDKQKERYKFINGLNVDLISVLSRDTKVEDFEEEDSNPIGNISEGNEEDEVLIDEEEDDLLSIEENDDETIEGLDNFF